MKNGRPSILILAAGLGTRLKSGRPKVLHAAAGRPLLLHVLEACRGLKTDSIGIVLGHGAGDVKKMLGETGFRGPLFLQKKLLGSGDAVRKASAWIGRGRGGLIVLCGDSPLLRGETLARLAKTHRQSGCAATVLTARVEEPAGYGRIVRRPDGGLEAIVEERDASPEIRALHEINTGVYCFETAALLSALPKLSNRNAKREYYLTDVIQILRAGGQGVGTCLCGDPEEALGVNSREDLAQAEAALRRRAAARWMSEGVTIVDPASTLIGPEVRIGPDTVLNPGTHLSGRVRIGSNCRIGPFACIEDSVLGDGVEFVASFAREARVEPGARVGPFSHLRPGAFVGRGAHIGNFSEIKKSRIGRGSKVNHLSYVGDASVGDGVNIGAGTITCNYDGVRKSRTVIGRGSFIGSNVNLVAPVRIGAGAVVGAGSTITRSVPDGSLALERSSEVVKKGWARRRFSGGRKDGQKRNLRRRKR